jgi:hypothetical protein
MWVDALSFVLGRPHDAGLTLFELGGGHRRHAGLRLRPPATTAGSGLHSWRQRWDAAAKTEPGPASMVDKQATVELP